MRPPYTAGYRLHSWWHWNKCRLKQLEMYLLWQLDTHWNIPPPGSHELVFTKSLQGLWALCDGRAMNAVWSSILTTGRQKVRAYHMIYIWLSLTIARRSLPIGDQSPTFPRQVFANPSNLYWLSSTGCMTSRRIIADHKIYVTATYFVDDGL